MAGIGKRRSERRKSRRKDFHADVVIRHDDLQFSGDVSNISDTGAYLLTNAPFAINDRVELTICFRHEAKKLSITVPGKVVRIDGHGVGVASSDMEMQRLMQLELIFDLNKEHVRELVEEFCRSISYP